MFWTSLIAGFQTVVLPKSVTPSRIIENLDSMSISVTNQEGIIDHFFVVFELPQEDFERLEKAAALHPPKRVVNPSKGWKLPFDVFDEE